MQVCILCGGTGTRLREETEFKPKPLIPIGGIPMVVHIMRWYAKYGFEDFVLALGYKQEQFKEYFAHFNEINNDVTIHTGGAAPPFCDVCNTEDLRPWPAKIWLTSQPPQPPPVFTTCGIEYHSCRDNWKVTLSDTGEDTFKGARLKRIEKYITGDTFMVCYGDGISDINIPELLKFHQSHGKMVTITGVHPAPRFGEIEHEQGRVLSFSEKPDGKCLINGGFYVFNRRIFEYLTTDKWCDLEAGTLELLAVKDEMRVFEHKGYWACMDTLRDMGVLQQVWASGNAPWKIS